MKFTVILFDIMSTIKKIQFLLQKTKQSIPIAHIEKFVLLGTVKHNQNKFFINQNSSFSKKPFRNHSSEIYCK